MDGEISSVLDEAFPDRDVADVRDAGASWNPSNRTVAVDFGDGETIYLKVATDGDGSRIARESAVIAYVNANTGVRAPTVVASDHEWAVPYLATAPLPGRELWRVWSDSSATERADLARRVGATLARLHERRFEEHAHVTGGGADGLELDPGPYADVVVDSITGMRGIAPSDRFDDYYEDVIAAVEDHRELLNEAPAALLHGDPAKPNCFVDEGGIGFVDWEIAHVGDPVRELVRVEDQQLASVPDPADERLVDALHGGYRERAGGLPPGYEERRPVYEAVRCLETAAFFDTWVEHVDEPEDELARWVRTEMDRKLAAL